MKFGAVLAVLSIIMVSCNSQIPMAGRLEVYVHWDNQPQVNKRVELVELKQEKPTNTAGLVDFNVLQGNYTLRVYDNKNLSGTSPLGLPRLRSAKRSILNGNNAKIHVASNGELHPQRLTGAVRFKNFMNNL
jgi:hypothetical protein